MVAGMVGQAFLTWWRVGDQGKDIAQLRADVDGLREWRALAREKLRNLERHNDEDEET
jgi:hypothetical protein